MAFIKKKGERRREESDGLFLVEVSEPLWRAAGSLSLVVHSVVRIATVERCHVLEPLPPAVDYGLMLGCACFEGSNSVLQFYKPPCLLKPSVRAFSADLSGSVLFPQNIGHGFTRSVQGVDGVLHLPVAACHVHALRRQLGGKISAQPQNFFLACILRTLNTQVVSPQCCLGLKRKSSRRKDQRAMMAEKINKYVHSTAQKLD